MSCFNFIPPGARESFFSDEAKAQRLSWFPPELLITERQQMRMRRLAYSEKETDRVVAAGNPSTGAYTLIALAQDESAKVRGWVARNPAVGPMLLAVLTEDEDPSIAAFAKFRLAELME